MTRKYIYQLELTFFDEKGDVIHREHEYFTSSNKVKTYLKNKLYFEGIEDYTLLPYGAITTEISHPAIQKRILLEKGVTSTHRAYTKFDQLKITQ